jgi:hypothetical protein
VFIPGRSRRALQTGVMSCTVVAEFVGKMHKESGRFLKKAAQKLLVALGRGQRNQNGPK